jgi:hypothetical protein
MLPQMASNSASVPEVVGVDVIPVDLLPFGSQLGQAALGGLDLALQRSQAFEPSARVHRGVRCLPRERFAQLSEAAAVACHLLVHLASAASDHAQRLRRDAFGPACVRR